MIEENKMSKVFRAPTIINLEITDRCNLKCRHCYNFWRRKQETGFRSMTKDSMNKLFDDFTNARIFHVVFSGGEPFLNFEVLEFGLKKMLDNDISVSCNSNLMLATDDKIKRLRDIGLDHILTSLNSHDSNTNDYLVNKKQAFKKITKGIETTRRHGIKVSVNMIVLERNKDHVYATGKLVHELGCQKIFGTRIVPTVDFKNISQTEFKLAEERVLHTLEQLIRVKKETGIMIGTLVSYPLCLLSDLEKYADFVGRGCMGQSGHLMSINVNGDTHACAHEEKSYGNIFEIGIYQAYRNMRIWHNKSLRYRGCRNCDYIEICRTGCRMSAHAYVGKYNEKDPLMINKDNFVKPYKIICDQSIYQKIDKGA